MISLRVSRARGKLGSEQLGYMYRKRLAGGGHRDTVEGERWAQPASSLPHTLCTAPETLSSPTGVSRSTVFHAIIISLLDPLIDRLTKGDGLLCNNNFCALMMVRRWVSPTKKVISTFENFQIILGRNHSIRKMSESDPFINGTRFVEVQAVRGDGQ